MGKVKDWVIEMEEDATTLTRDEWVEKHGETVIEFYDDFKRRQDNDKPEQGELFDV